MVATAFGDGTVQMTSFLSDEPATPKRPHGGGHTFEANLDLAELDERGRMAQTWSAQARTISKSELVFVSRRMCYPDRPVIVAVYLADSDPVGLFGYIGECEYEADGLYRCVLMLSEIPKTQATTTWFKNRTKR